MVELIFLANTALAALKASYSQYNEAAKTLTVTIEKRNNKQEVATPCAAITAP